MAIDKIEISFGWLSCTIPVIHLQEFYTLIGDTPVPREYGFRGYECSAMILGTGLVGWSTARPEAHIDLSAQALSLIKGGHVDSILDIIDWVFDKDGHLTRLDISYDDRIGIVTVAEVQRALSCGDVVTRWHKWRPDGDYKIGSPAVDGGTVYIGSRKSDVFLRIYDKAKAQGLENTHWTRFEIQLRKDSATSLARLLCNTKNDEDLFIELSLGILRGYIEFKDRNSDSNPSRRTNLDWWDKIIGDVSKVKASKVKSERTISKVHDWVDNQVAPSLAVLKDFYGERWHDVLADCMKNGKSRWKAPHLAMLKGKEKHKGMHYLSG